MSARLLLASMLACPLPSWAGPPAAAGGSEDPALKARLAYKTHQPDQPLSENPDARSVQEGCAAPCAEAAEIALYIEKVKLVARDLGIPQEETQAVLENYAPGGKPRIKAGAGASASAPQTPSPLDARAVTELLSRQNLPGSQRAALQSKANRWASLLDQRRSTEGTPDGGAVNSAQRLSAEQTRQLLSQYVAARPGDSRYTRTLPTRAPPQTRAAQQLPESLTTMQRFALWVDDKVGSKNLQAAAEYSAGFGDALSLNATRYVRNHTCNCGVDEGSDRYVHGNYAGVAYSLAMGGAGVLKPLNAGAQTIGRWAPTIAADGQAVLREGQFVMAGTSRGIAGAINWLKAGGPELAWKAGPQYMTGKTMQVAGSALRYPIAEEGRIMGVIKGLMGQRVYVGPPPVVPFP